MNLQLSLKKNWFEMTKSGEKTEDYREITQYWCNRLLVKKMKGVHRDNIEPWGKIGIVEDSQFKHFETNTMTLGYPKKGDKERTLILEHKGIEIRTGNPHWGAEPNKLYFVIKHGVCLNEA